MFPLVLFQSCSGSPATMLPGLETGEGCPTVTGIPAYFGGLVIGAIGIGALTVAFCKVPERTAEMTHPELRLLRALLFGLLSSIVSGGQLIM